ncbi:MAG: PAS domain S-box protein [Planctomycetes bacterium]|nr:PAS domain S-box protein [Planctomycetota bacterium]
MADKAESYEQQSRGNLNKQANSTGKRRLMRQFSPVTIVLAASTLTILLLSGLGWEIWKSYLDIKWAQENAFPIQSLRSQIVLFDEILTMSASMSAATGDPEWEERYHQYKPQLETAIKRLEKLVQESFGTDAVLETRKANDKLVEMENKIFKLVDQKRLGEAQSIFSSKDFRKQKELYRKGMEQIETNLEKHINTDLENDRQRAFIALESVLLGLPLLTIIWLLTVITMRQYLKERDRAEQELKLNEERFHSLVSNIPGIIYRCELSYPWAVEHISETIFEISGYHAEDLLEGRVRGIGTLIVTEDIEDVKHLVAEATELHQPFELKYRIQHADGGIRWVHEKGQTIFNAEGKPVWLDGVILDITERKKVEEEIKQAKENHERLANNLIGCFVFRHDLSDRMTYVSNSVTNVLGYTPEEFLVNYNEFLTDHPINRQIAEHMVQTLKGIQEPPFEVQAYHKDRSIRWLEASRTAVRDRSGNIVAAEGVVYDITERKKAEHEIVNLAKFPSENPNPVLRIAGDGILLYANNACESILQEWGCRKGEFVGNEWCGIVSEALDTGGEKIVVRELAGRVLSFAVAPVIDAGYANLYCRDITERKRAEQKTQESEQRFRSLFESCEDFIHLLNVNAEILETNKKTLNRLGYQEDEFIGHRLDDFFPPDSKRRFRENFPQLLKGEPYHQEVELICKNGDTIPIDCVATAIKDPQKRISFCVFIQRDITERKKAENERECLVKMLQSKTKEMESLLRIVSHDIRSPLVNIQGFSEELTLDCREMVKIVDALDMDEQTRKTVARLSDENIPESINFISTSVKKMDSLLSALSQLAKAGRVEINIKPLDINTMVSDVIGNLNYQAKEIGATITCDDLCSCYGDQVQINQVFSNLLSNALKYLDQHRKGVIHISGWTDDSTATYCVEDNGIGIPANHIDRIFELFHRVDSKSPVSGEGLGLATVKQIVDRQRGKIWVESEPGKGSRFFISFPKVS